eukprot:1872736-Rhodomonas_salina.2
MCKYGIDPIHVLNAAILQHLVPGSADWVALQPQIRQIPIFLEQGEQRGKPSIPDGASLQVDVL